MMYVIESPEHGFTSIPQSIYWAIITITTVGYGDIVPHTVLGKFISSFAMIIGYAIIAVPTGIVTVEMTKASVPKRTCLECGSDNGNAICNQAEVSWRSEADSSSRCKKFSPAAMKNL